MINSLLNKSVFKEEKIVRLIGCFKKNLAVSKEGAKFAKSVKKLY